MLQHYLVRASALRKTVDRRQVNRNWSTLEQNHQAAAHPTPYSRTPNRFSKGKEAAMVREQTMRPALPLPVLQTRTMGSPPAQGEKR